MTCPTCGPTETITTQSHEQCAKCGRVIEACCEGEQSVSQTCDPEKLYMPPHDDPGHDWGWSKQRAKIRTAVREFSKTDNVDRK